jgi:hypothetical protein
MTYRPNKDVVADMCKRFVDLSGEMLNTQTDPEGRTLNLAITMFFGVALTECRDFADRRLMCDSAMGYSSITDESLAKLK